MAQPSAEGSVSVVKLAVGSMIPLNTHTYRVVDNQRYTQRTLLKVIRDYILQWISWFKKSCVLNEVTSVAGKKE